MRKLFKKRLLGIPVAVLLILALTAGVVATGYVVIQGTVTVEVLEAFEVHYSLDGTNWIGPVGNNFHFDITGAYPGDCVTIDVRITNASSNSLLGKVSIIPRTAGWLVLTEPVSALFKDGICIQAGVTVERSITVCVACDAPPGTYTVDIEVLRDCCV